MLKRLEQYSREFRRFCLVGLANTAVDFGVFWALMAWAGFWIGPAHVLSFSAATLNSYLMNKYWTFGHSTRPKAKEMRRFALVALVGLALSSLVIVLLADYAGAYPAKIAAIIIGLAWNYLGSRRVLGARVIARE